VLNLMKGTLRNLALNNIATNKYNYLRPLRTVGARPPLFCFFPRPSRRTRFRGLSAGGYQSVYEFYYPNLYGASKFPSIAELASAYIEEFAKFTQWALSAVWATPRPGLLAFETARLFAAMSEPVSPLALFETWHPQFLYSLSPVESMHFRFAYIYDRAMKYCVDLFRADLAGFKARVQRAILRKSKNGI